jgi:tRNA (guanine-N(7)-)-methyltransferase
VESDTSENIFRTLRTILDSVVRAGVTVKPATPPEAVLPYLQLCSQILVMTVEPGFGGQKFMQDMMPKLRTIAGYIAAENPDCNFLGIERMLERVRLFDGKCRRANLANAKVLRLEALYTFHYLLPAHHARTVYVFFPDPWPKKKHHSHRLFGPLFRTALWKRLEIGGKLEFATDHKEYFDEVCEGFASDQRFERVEPMPRPKEVWTEFETMFREQGLPIYSAAWKSLPGEDAPLAPLTIPPEAEPREGIVRRCSKTP